MQNNLLSLEWIVGGNCPAIRGNPISSSTSFDRGNLNGIKMKEIVLTQGKVALVDDEDYEYLNQFKWCAANNGGTFYAIRKACYDGKWITERMHRVLFDIPPGKEIDHIDHNGLNNQRGNLRIVTRQQNKFNARAWGQSKYLGVSIYNDNGRKYIAANIWINGKKKYLGFFPTEEAAALAYNEAAIGFQGEYANLNKITKENEQ